MTELAAAELLQHVDIDHARRELREVKNGLRKLEVIDEFAHTYRDFGSPLALTEDHQVSCGP